MDDGKQTSTTAAKAEAAKDKVVKPKTETKVKDAAEAVSEATHKATSTASEQAGKAKRAAGDALNEAKAEAKTQIGEAKATAKAKLDETKTKAQDRAREEAETRKAQATSALSTTASDLRRASEVVEESWMTKALSTAATSLEDFTQSLDSKSPAELQAVAQRTAREHPGLFLAGCFAAGVALSRTLRVAQARARDDSMQRGYGGYDNELGSDRSYASTSLPQDSLNTPSGAYADPASSEGAYSPSTPATGDTPGGSSTSRS